MTIDLSRLKFSTKGLIAALLSLGSLLQIPQVSAAVFAFIKLHPHWATAFATLTGLITLLHNPEVQTILGIQQTAEKVGNVSSSTLTVTGATAEDAAKIVAAQPNVVVEQVPVSPNAPTRP